MDFYGCGKFEKFQRLSNECKAHLGGGRLGEQETLPIAQNLVSFKDHMQIISPTSDEDLLCTEEKKPNQTENNFA